MGRLVITRGRGKSVQIGEAMVTVEEVRGGQAKLLIEAPPHIHVRRAELEPLPKSLTPATPR